MSMLRTALTTAAPAVRGTRLAMSSRALHSSPVAYKSTTEKVKEVADKVNMTVGKKLASAIEKGEEVTEATKESVSPAVRKAKEATGQASQKAKETTDQASQKANQTSAGVREGAHDFKKDVQKEARK